MDAAALGADRLAHLLVNRSGTAERICEAIDKRRMTVAATLFHRVAHGLVER